MPFLMPGRIMQSAYESLVQAMAITTKESKHDRTRSLDRYRHISTVTIFFLETHISRSPKIR